MDAPDISRSKAQGVTMLLVEQVSLDVADQGYGLEDGHAGGHGPAGQ